MKQVLNLRLLKQESKKWHKKFNSKIMSNGFIHNSINKCLYTKVCDSIITFVCLYMDDMLIISNDMEGLKDMKMFLSSTFKMKDFG